MMAKRRPYVAFGTLFVLSAALGASSFMLGSMTIANLSVRYAGYRPDTFLAYAHNASYGDYEHSAIYFGIVPKIHKNIRNAQVIFLGSSHPQLAFSTEATRSFFESRGISTFNLAFGYTEQNIFAEKLLAHVQAAPRVIIINADPFFSGYVSEPAKATLTGGLKTISTAILKSSFQKIHRWICPSLPRVCGNTEISYFRSARDGQVSLPRDADKTWAPIHGGAAVQYQTIDGEKWTMPELSPFLAEGERFLQSQSIARQCVVLTWVPDSTPSPFDNMDTAAAIASRLGTRFIMPQLDGLVTYDGSHLDSPSAERWSAAFLDQLAPILSECRVSASQKRT